MRGDLAKAFELANTQVFRRAPLPKSYTDFIGRKLFLAILTAQGLGAFALITLAVILKKSGVAQSVMQPRVRHEISRAGVALMPMFLFLALALGFLVVGQTVSALAKVGATDYLGSTMVIVIVRELGPLLTAVLVLARVGTANVIELGTARALGEVEALEALGIDPVHYLIVPRVIGMALGIFALTIYLILGALGSGYLFAFLQDVALTPGDYFRQIAEALNWLDFALLALKTLAFGFFIAVVTCYHGLAQPPRAAQSGLAPLPEQLGHLGDHGPEAGAVQADPGQQAIGGIGAGGDPEAGAVLGQVGQAEAPGGPGQVRLRAPPGGLQALHAARGRQGLGHLGLPAQAHGPVAAPEAQGLAGVGPEAPAAQAVKGVGDLGLEAGAAEIQEGLAIQAGQIHGQVPALQEPHHGPGGVLGGAQSAGEAVARAPRHRAQGHGTSGSHQGPAGMVEGAVAAPDQQGAAGGFRQGDGGGVVEGRLQPEQLQTLPVFRGEPGQERLRIHRAHPGGRVVDQRNAAHSALGARNRAGGASSSSRTPVMGCSSTSFQACSQSWLDFSPW